MPLAYWVDNFNPYLVHFGGNFGIHYYGVAYVLGFIGGAWLLYHAARTGRSLVSAEKVPDLMTAAILGVLVGGRLGSYLLYDGWRRFPSDPFEILRVWDGGMASHGGMIGVALGIAWFARAEKIPFLHVGDLIVSATPLGLGLGRLANFVNGELWGKVTTVSWAVIFPKSDPGVPVALIAPRHPSQLYEAALEGALLLAVMQWRFWRTDVVRRQPGRLSGEFFLIYAILRIIGERFREPDSDVTLILGLSRGTFYSIFVMGIGLWLCLRRKNALGTTRPAL